MSPTPDSAGTAAGAMMPTYRNPVANSGPMAISMGPSVLVLTTSPLGPGQCYNHTDAPDAHPDAGFRYGLHHDGECTSMYEVPCFG